MTPLATEIHKILIAESAYPPLSAESISKVLFYTGAGQTVERIPVTVIESALAELMQAGQVEAVHSARLGARYRIAHNVQVGNVNESISEQVAE